MGGDVPVWPLAIRILNTHMAKQRSRRKRVLAVSARVQVSLEEAKALAAVRSPAAAAGAVAPAPTPAEVGRARQQLEAAQQTERQRRIREYTATLTIMKRRGVKGLAGSDTLGAEPLQIFAEGDSWFDYPVPLFGGGIIPRLEKRVGVPILNLAKAGDEVRFMLGVTERKIIAAQFTAGCPAGGPWDAMLFSGGGNDIVDNPMALWINDFDPNRPAAAQINQARLDAALSIVRAGYEDLVSMRDALSPDTHLFVHAYDFAIPDGRGVCHFGPWLKPTFDLRRFPDLPTAAAVVKVMLQQFAAMLESLADSRSRMTVINGQGTLEAVAKSWHNELHPAKAGFNAFADVFRDRLKQVFPNRIL
jgi:hypothetical protein